MIFGARTKSAIDALGISTKSVANKSGVPADRLDAILAGSTPSTWELSAIAGALAIDPASLFRGDVLSDRARSIARFRAPQGIPRLNSDDTRLLSLAAEAGRTCAFLRASLGKDTSRLSSLRKVKGVRPTIEPWRQGYDLGREARMQLAPEPRPLGSVQQLLEDAGVHVAAVLFSTEDIEAASLFERDACPVILLNRRNNRIKLPLSRRAVLAHELCHILHDGGERDLLTVVSRQSAEDPIEKRANGFAPNFLAPLEWLSPKARSPRRVVREIAEHWGLSFEGAAWHAKHLDRISDKQAESFARHPEDIPVASEQELPRTPPEQFGIGGVKVSPVANGLLAEMALLAMVEGIISKGRAVEILSLQ